MADPHTNSLICTGTAQAIATFRDAVKLIDRPIEQLALEFCVAELDANGARLFGLPEDTPMRKWIELPVPSLRSAITDSRAHVLNNPWVIAGASIPASFGVRAKDAAEGSVVTANAHLDLGGGTPELVWLDLIVQDSFGPNDPPFADSVLLANGKTGVCILSRDEKTVKLCFVTPRIIHEDKDYGQPKP